MPWASSSHLLLTRRRQFLSHLEGQSPPILYDSEGRFLRVRSAVTGKDHRLPVVDVYKHLGGIVTASGTPVPEISYRHALAWSVVRPLRARLFSAVGIPFSTRCHLLRSLAMSKYAFGSAALSLSSGIHRRLWAKHYVALWRTLWRRRQGDHYRHSYAVLSAVGAPTPPLALALARAVLLRQISTHGPDTLLHLLQVHWCECPKRSWLGQVLADIHHVSQYVSAAGTLVETGAPLRFLLEAVQDEPRWWVRQVKSACRQAQKDMAAWCSGTSRAILPGSCEGSRPDVGVDHPFQCLWCGAAFSAPKASGCPSCAGSPNLLTGPPPGSWHHLCQLSQMLLDGFAASAAFCALPMLACGGPACSFRATLLEKCVRKRVRIRSAPSRCEVAPGPPTVRLCRSSRHRARSH